MAKKKAMTATQLVCKHEGKLTRIEGGHGEETVLDLAVLPGSIKNCKANICETVVLS